MPDKIIDIHPHIISTDTRKYPQAPLFGVQSEWSKKRPVSAEQLIGMMDEAGVDKAAVVHSSTCYGFDCSYLADNLERHRDRFAGVGSIDMLAPDAVRTARHWIGRGFEGLRLFTGGTTRAMDASGLDDPNTYPVWEVLNEEGLVMCIQTDQTGAAAIMSLARRFAKVKIIIDHLARPDVSDGPPYEKAKSLFDMAIMPNIYLKVSTNAVENAHTGKASPETLFRKLVDVFGADRLAWGSNFPAAPETLPALVEKAKKGFSSLSGDERAWMLRKTAQKLFPSLADVPGA
jgi:L-fuconolactonase